MPKYQDVGFDPPAPVALVTLISLDNSAQIENVPMLLDSGADVSLIPASAAKELNLEFSGGYKLEGFEGSTATAPAVDLRLRLLDLAFKGRFLVLEQAWGVLGRNVLNSISLSLDGPRLVWEATA